MTERGLTSADGSPACPFVAFDDDRDERADRPDHRHRCFAEDPPAPRAHAHQEAYCLSSAFPVCPVFQDWARREAARARPDAGPTAAAAAAAGAGASDAATHAEADDATSDPGSDDPTHDPRGADEWAGPSPDVPVESTPRRNPPRDWAAPPPWANPPGGAGRSGGFEASVDGGEDVRKPRPVEGAGLAGSAADRLASGGSFIDPGAGPAGPTTSRPADVPSSGPDAELAGLVGGVAAASAGSSADARLAADRAAARAADDADFERVTGASRSPSAKPGRSVSSTRSHAAPRDKPPQREHVQHDGPSWERARRFEAYPQIRSRAGMPALPRIAVLGAALGVAALLLFFLPAFLGVGGEEEPTDSPNPSIVAETPTPEPTPEPDPTPQVYTIKEGDTLSAIAKEFGLTVDQLLEANEETISNPNRISVGDEIIIPTPPPDEVEEEPSATPEE